MAGKGKRVQKGRDLQEHPEALPASGRTFLFSFNLPVITKADIRVFLVTGKRGGFFGLFARHAGP